MTGQGGASQSSFITYSYSSLGALRWSQQYTGSSPAGNHRATAIALGPKGSVAITGRVPFTTIRYRERN